MYNSYMPIKVSIDRLISSSEARKRFGFLLKEVSSDEMKYFVILDNGKVSALLVNPEWFSDHEDAFPDLSTLRKSWKRSQKSVESALKKLDKVKPEQLPKFLRS